MPVKVDKSIGFIITASLLVLVTLAVIGPIPQDPGYHNFADQRTLFGLPNFLDTISSAAYLIAGACGLVILHRKNIPGGLPELRTAYATFFTGVLLTGAGSTWYHLDPSNSSLFWDRMPMTVAFMAFFTVIIGEYYSARTGRLLLWPLVTAGLCSVVYWYAGELAGTGDLRPYVLVQFLPMLLIPVIIILRPAHLRPEWSLWCLMICYLLAKILEFYDREIYAMAGLVSGHTLKHLVSAAGTGFFFLALKNRRVSGTVRTI